MFAPTQKPKARALLVGTYERLSQKSEAASLLEELKELVDTLGVPVAESMLVHVREPHAALFIGKGKAQEMVDWCREHKVDLIVLDHELTPAQQRNWEKMSGLAVIDREEVILGIFAKRAQTREARLQISLAQMQYSLPRLTRAWSHFGQQGGGIGGKGEGETQLELDRRMLRGQIERVKSDLQKVRQQRATQRKVRQRVPVPTAAIVGYTNAGKSSLLKRLTGADVLVEDKLFATLDTTTRRVSLPNGQLLLLTDTVGFVRRLPHRLVEAFNATLEETLVSDFLIHLIDASQAEAGKFYQTTMDVLHELGADEKKMLLVFNKIDKITDPEVLVDLRRQFPEAVFISVATGKGVEEFLTRLTDFIQQERQTVRLSIPMDRADLIAQLHRDGDVLEKEYIDSTVSVVVVLPRQKLSLYEVYIQKKQKPDKKRRK